MLHIPIQTISFYNEPRGVSPQPEEVVIPIQTISFYNKQARAVADVLFVVIPIQTISFYNNNEKQMKTFTKNVVIPIQTISFYNKRYGYDSKASVGCHTYPNDKLLQLQTDEGGNWKQGCHTYPNDKLLQRPRAKPKRLNSSLSYLSKR